jgi:dipeptide/tripeptide permease
MAGPIAASTGAEKEGFVKQIQGLDGRFWIVNVMEMFERFAYYGVRAVIAIYIVLAESLGGPELTHVQKGSIFAWWAAVQSFLPMFTGGLADFYGHKRTIFVAIIIKIIGYAMMATFKSYEGFMAGCLMLAAGTALFKPGVQGTLAATLKKSSASMGWGIFYLLVNIGGFLGPIIAGVLRGFSWPMLFYSCAGIVAINFLWLPFYEDPSRAPGVDPAKAARSATSVISRRLSKNLLRLWAALLAVFALIYGVVHLKAAFGQEGAPTALWVCFGLIGLSTAFLSVHGAAKGFNRSAWIPAFFLTLVSMFLSFGVLTFGYVGAGPEPLFISLSGGSVVGNVIFDLCAFAVYACWIPASFLAVFLFYNARKDHYDQGASTPGGVFVVSVVGLFQHRVLFFIVAFSGFWLMFNQVFDLLPNFIDDWVDSSDLIAATGSAFTSSPIVPNGLAALLALIFGGVCAGIVFLALRPDRQKLSDAMAPSYIVVAIALVLAFYFPLHLILTYGGALETALALAAVLVMAAEYERKIQFKHLAILAFILAAVGSFLAMRGYFLGVGPELSQMAEDGKQVNPEFMINLNPGLIVFTMIFFAYLSSFMPILVSIVLGMIVATGGSLLAGTATTGWICLAGILTFSVGEMLSSPKKMEYLASLAPKGQEGLFMGYANAPVGIGWITGSILAGSRYEKYGDKVNLAKKYMVEELNMSTDVVMGVVGSDGEVISKGIEKTQVMPTLAEKLNISLADAQSMLYDKYDPADLWVLIAWIGLFSIAAMVIYGLVLKSIDSRAGARDLATASALSDVPPPVPAPPADFDPEE